MSRVGLGFKTTTNGWAPGGEGNLLDRTLKICDKCIFGASRACDLFNTADEIQPRVSSVRRSLERFALMQFAKNKNGNDQ